MVLPERGREQFARASDVVGADATGEQAVMTNAMKAARRRMNSWASSVIVLYRSRPSIR
jgi:hypothetical protein